MVQVIEVVVVVRLSMVIVPLSPSISGVYIAFKGDMMCMSLLPLMALFC